MLEQGETPAGEVPTPPGPKRARAPKGLTNRALGGMLWTFSGTGVQAVVQVLVIDGPGAVAHTRRVRRHGRRGRDHRAVPDRVADRGRPGDRSAEGPRADPHPHRLHDLGRSRLRARRGPVARRTGPGGVLSDPGSRAGASAGWRCCSRSTGSTPSASRCSLGSSGFGCSSPSMSRRYIVGLRLYRRAAGLAGLRGVGAGRGQPLAGHTADGRDVSSPPGTRSGRASISGPRKDLLSFGFGHSLAQVALVLSQQGDNMVVGRWLGPAALGIYGRAYSLMVMPATVFGKIVNRVLFPVMAHVQDERARLAGRLRAGARHRRARSRSR